MNKKARIYIKDIFRYTVNRKQHKNQNCEKQHIMRIFALRIASHCTHCSVKVHLKALNS